MPGGKIAFYTGIIDQPSSRKTRGASDHGATRWLHALREHARERIGKSQATSIGLSIGAQLLGLASWAMWLPTWQRSC